MQIYSILQTLLLLGVLQNSILLRANGVGVPGKETAAAPLNCRVSYHAVQPNYM